MKFFVIAFAVIAAASAASISVDYLPPVDNNIEASELIESPIEQGVLADDGYRYKAVRRLRLRHRRDVSELPSGEYLPPVQEASQDIAVEVPLESAPQTVLADDGYRYKAVRRRVIRRRRDVNELPTAEYLPPVQEASQDIAVEVPLESAPQTVLADDGYRYKTVRRRVIRRRRDVNELPTAEYLPPVQEASQDIAVEVPLESAPQTVLADDGYRYKAVRRRVIRRRRDVSELSSEYLPPVQEASQDIAVEVPLESAPQTVLADDGYRYKTVRRRVIRRRRDVNELPTAEYLPPVQEASQDIAVEVPLESAPQTVLADDGYRYKAVRRRVIRRRRDVSELSSEYLPPVQEASQDIAVEVPLESAPQTVLADDGYRYKTVRRRVIRRRRDVNELPTAEYLPPVQEASQDIAVEVPLESAPQTVLADDGYRYKAVRRRVIRRRRDVSELSSEYLPPVQEASQDIAVEVPLESAPQTVLADDGYRYKTVRRRVIRRRRDVSELPSAEYLPPAEEYAASAIIDVPAEQTVLANDGYRYKTVRRLKLRRH